MREDYFDSTKREKYVNTKTKEMNNNNIITIICGKKQTKNLLLTGKCLIQLNCIESTAQLQKSWLIMKDAQKFKWVKTKSNKIQNRHEMKMTIWQWQWRSTGLSKCLNTLRRCGQPFQVTKRTSTDVRSGNWARSTLPGPTSTQMHWEWMYGWLWHMDAGNDFHEWKVLSNGDTAWISTMFPKDGCQEYKNRQETIRIVSRYWPVWTKGSLGAITVTTGHTANKYKYHPITWKTVAVLSFRHACIMLNF